MSAPTSVSVHLPTGWIELDPRESDLIEELERALKIPEEHREQVLSLLTPLSIELGRMAMSTEVVLVGLFAHVIPVEEATNPLVLTGHLVLAISPPVASMDAVRSALQQDGADVEPIELPVGAAVLSTRTIELSHSSWSENVPARARRYFAPLPGTDRVATLSFVTPNLDLAEQFDEVFDGIARTLEFGYATAPQPPATSTT